MSKNKSLLKEAIIDAAEVRETALQQAKITMDEIFTPRLQSMFSTRLKEAMDEDEQTEPVNEEDESEEINLESILAELESELDENEVSEVKKDDEKSEKDEKPEKEEKPEEDEKDVSELSMDELEELIRTIVSDEMGEGDKEEEEVPEEDSEEVPAIDDGPELDKKEEEEDELNLDELLAELAGEDENEDEDDSPEIRKDNGIDEEVRRLKEELRLAMETVSSQRQQLQEINLLNAKLIYVNKIFKAKNLTESQKIKVLKTFDKASSAKEAKLIFESISDSFTLKPERGQIKESLGFASRAVNAAPRPTNNQVIETDGFITRMQKLANIKL